MILKNRFFGKKMVELLPARFQGPPFFGCYFFWAFFFFLFLFLLHLARGCAKFAHPSKASSDIMQQQGSKAKTPQKKGVHFFFGNPFFDHFFKNTNFAPPPENCAQKNLQKTLFLYAQKKVAKLLTQRWPSYWPYFGQKMAKLLTLQHIYIYIETHDEFALDFNMDPARDLIPFNHFRNGTGHSRAYW